MNMYSHQELFEEYNLDVLSGDILHKIDLFLCNTDLDDNQKRNLINLILDIYKNGFHQ